MHQFVDGAGQRLAGIAERSERDAGEHGKDHDLQNLVLRHRFGERAGNEVVDEVLQRELGSRQIGRRAHVRQRQVEVFPRFQEVGDDQAQRQGDQRSDDEPAERTGKDTAHGFCAAHVRDADDQRGKHQGADQHLDQAQEDIREDRDITRDLLGGFLVGGPVKDQPADKNAEKHRNQDENGR